VTHSIPPLKELRGIKGLWQYLITRSQLKAKIEIERERSKAYADHRDRLPDALNLSIMRTVREGDSGSGRTNPLVSS
jgi:hypothetical protein